MPKNKLSRPSSGVSRMIDAKKQEYAASPVLPVICEREAYYRRKLGIRQKDLAEKLGLKANAVGAWENGRSRPDIDSLPKMCEIFGISLYDIYGLEDPNKNPGRDEKDFSRREIRLIEKFRTLNPDNRYILEKILDDISEVQEHPFKRNLYVKDFYEGKSVAAGIGDPSEIYDSSTKLYVYADMVSEKGELVFRVNGDSMEPAYRSGDLVLVEDIRNAPKLRYGETGIFINYNELYIKEYQPDGLYSTNPKYEPIRFTADDQVYIIGRVLEKIPEEAIATYKDIEKFEAYSDD